MFYKEYAFTLPKGFVAEDGNYHRQGMMRPTTGKDEIYVQSRLNDGNAEEMVFLLLSRVVTSLGTISPVSAEILAQLFLVDFAYLQEFYQNLNPSAGDLAAGEL